MQNAMNSLSSRKRKRRGVNCETRVFVLFTNIINFTTLYHTSLRLLMDTTQASCSCSDQRPEDFLSHECLSDSGSKHSDLNPNVLRPSSAVSNKYVTHLASALPTCKHVIVVVLHTQLLSASRQL